MQVRYLAALRPDIRRISHPLGRFNQYRLSLNHAIQNGPIIHCRSHKVALPQLVYNGPVNENPALEG